MIPVMCQAADKWQQLKKETPEKLQMFLKLAIIKQLLISLYKRLTATSRMPRPWLTPRVLAGWTRTRAGGFFAGIGSAKPRGGPILQAGSTKNLSIKSPMFEGQQGQSSTVQISLSLESGYDGDWIQFQIVISLRAEAAPLWTTLTLWIGQSSWHTLGCRMRWDRPTYDSLTTALWN